MERLALVVQAISNVSVADGCVKEGRSRLGPRVFVKAAVNANHHVILLLRFTLRRESKRLVLELFQVEEEARRLHLIPRLGGHGGRFELIVLERITSEKTARRAIEAAHLRRSSSLESVLSADFDWSLCHVLRDFLRAARIALPRAHLHVATDHRALRIHELASDFSVAVKRRFFRDYSTVHWRRVQIRLVHVGLQVNICRRLEWLTQRHVLLSRALVKLEWLGSLSSVRARLGTVRVLVVVLLARSAQDAHLKVGCDRSRLVVVEGASAAGLSEVSRLRRVETHLY